MGNQKFLLMVNDVGKSDKLIGQTFRDKERNKVINADQKERNSNLSADSLGLQDRKLIDGCTSIFLRVVEEEGIGKRLVAARPIRKGTVISTFSSPVVSTPTVHTVCFGEGKHVQPTLGTEFTEHTCGLGNLQLIVNEDETEASFVIIKDVMEGESITFNYCTTEWEMGAPFLCGCDLCKKNKFPKPIQGCKFLTLEERKLIFHQCSPYIQNKCKREVKAFLAWSAPQAK